MVNKDEQAYSTGGASGACLYATKPLDPPLPSNNIFITSRYKLFFAGGVCVSSKELIDSSGGFWAGLDWMAVVARLKSDALSHKLRTLIDV